MYWQTIFFSALCPADAERTEWGDVCSAYLSRRRFDLQLSALKARADAGMRDARTSARDPWLILSFCSLQGSGRFSDACAQPLMRAILVVPWMPHRNDFKRCNINRWLEKPKPLVIAAREMRRNKRDQVVGLKEFGQKQKARDGIAYVTPPPDLGQCLVGRAFERSAGRRDQDVVAAAGSLRATSCASSRAGVSAEPLRRSVRDRDAARVSLTSQIAGS